VNYETLPKYGIATKVFLFGFSRGALIARHFAAWLDKLGTARQAGEIAAVLVDFQNGPVDSAAIYDARCGVGNYSPLFNPLTYKPHKACCAFLAFNELRKAGTAVAASSDDSDVLVSAARKGGNAVVMIVNLSSVEKPLALDAGDGRKAVSCRITDATRSFEEAELPSVLPPTSFVVTELAY
jgi:hypothetical protein